MRYRLPIPRRLSEIGVTGAEERWQGDAERKRGQPDATFHRDRGRGRVKASTARSTTRIRVVLGCSIILVVIAVFQQVVGAQAQPRPLITEAVSDTKLVTLAGNTRPEANARNDRGPVADSFRIEHMFLQLRRSPEREQALEQYINQLSDPKSPNY